MRTYIVAAILVGATGAHARADAKLDELKHGYEREAAGCKVSAGGVRKVADGAAELAKATPPPDDKAALDADVDRLVKGAAVVQGYCDELAGVLEVLTQAPAGTPYKKLERDLDERDNRIRKGRAASKKTLADLEPVSHRLIPRINAARVAGPPPSTDKKLPAKFPSGHAALLPVLPGKWQVTGTAATDTADYTDAGVSAYVTVRPFAKATCDQQKKALAADAPTDLAVSGSPGLAWVVGFTRKDHALQVACATQADGGFVGTFDVAPASAAARLAPDLQALMLRMLAAARDH